MLASTAEHKALTICSTSFVSKAALMHIRMEGGGKNLSSSMYLARVMNTPECARAWSQMVSRMSSSSSRVLVWREGVRRRWMRGDLGMDVIARSRSPESAPVLSCSRLCHRVWKSSVLAARSVMSDGVVSRMLIAVSAQAVRKGGSDAEKMYPDPFSLWWNTSALEAAQNPPPAANPWLRLPVKSSTSRRSTPVTSVNPRPVAPRVPMECDSSSTSRNLYFSFSAMISLRGHRSP